MTTSFVRKFQAAKLLGVTPRTLSRWHKSGKLPAVKLSRSVVGYRSDALKKFMAGKGAQPETQTP